MITEKQVEYIIIPMSHEHFVILAPNIIIIFLTIILIIFYIRQSSNIRQEVVNRKNELNSIQATLSLPNIRLNSSNRLSSNKTKSLIIFPQ